MSEQRFWQGVVSLEQRFALAIWDFLSQFKEEERYDELKRFDFLGDLEKIAGEANLINGMQNTRAFLVSQMESFNSEFFNEIEGYLLTIVKTRKRGNFKYLGVNRW